jgi:hypothetical protein
MTTVCEAEIVLHMAKLTLYQLHTCVKTQFPLIFSCSQHCHYINTLTPWSGNKYLNITTWQCYLQSPTFRLQNSFLASKFFIKKTLNKPQQGCTRTATIDPHTHAVPLWNRTQHPATQFTCCSGLIKYDFIN